MLRRFFPVRRMKQAPRAAEAVPHGVPQTGNVHGPSIHKRGDTEQGFKDADVVVEGHYVTQVQTHSALETHGVVADWKPELLTVWASTQGTASVREEMAGFFKIPMTKVRVITEYMGGGFGAKFGAGNFGVVAAALSKQTGAPVRLMLDRQEEHLSVGNRPSSDQMLRIGAKKDGTITAIHLIAMAPRAAGRARAARVRHRTSIRRPRCTRKRTTSSSMRARRRPCAPQGIRRARSRWSRRSTIWR